MYRRAINRQLAPCFSVLVALAFWTASSVLAGDLPRLVSKTVFVASPNTETAVWANTFYSHGTGQDMMAVVASEKQSDVYTDWQQSFSTDNGQTWTAWQPTPNTSATLTPQPGWVDPETGRMLTIMLDQNNPNNAFALRYRVSTDGGHSNSLDQPIVQAGRTPENPFLGVSIGADSLSVGATACRPIRTNQEHVLLPVQVTTTTAECYDSAVLIGSWTEAGTIDWTMSDRVQADPAASPRGYFEPTLAEMPDNRILMVMRGSNAANPSLPGHKWYSVSTDGGWHWTAAGAWTYTDGSTFYSPSSCSQLLHHSNGKYYWIGNISSTNPNGNDPRYPLVIGEIDPNSLLLRRDTVTAIDRLAPGENKSLQFSNFLAHEDRATREIVLNMTRFMPTPNWQGDAYIYRIAVPAPEPSGVVMMSSAVAGLLACAWRRVRNFIGCASA